MNAAVLLFLFFIFLPAEIGQQPFAEVFRILNRQADYRVECALRHWGMYSRYSVEAVYEEIPPGLVLVKAFPGIEFGSLDGCLGCNLAEERRAEPCLAESEDGSGYLPVAGHDHSDADSAF